MTNIKRRTLLEETWLDLVNNILPEISKIHHLPIKNNHCFVRCILDNVFDQPWDRCIPRPAYKNISDLDLEVAIIFAKRVIENPNLVIKLNNYSLHLRNTTHLTHTNKPLDNM